ncbi:MAG TPA: VPLPA-CTERM sorting domain-containing protein [Aestuariivirga sp.]|nr:VPLPA-CTERM sorting domain-containing protein [Aestuariivirga sp.]
MSADVTGNLGMFNGNCNLSSTCDYSLDSYGDFWSSFDTFTGQQILFITGNDQIWAAASYAAVQQIINDAAEVFTPNITWSDAGLGGFSIGSVVGNILQRAGVSEDPWITLLGDHCNPDCSGILWGESNYYHPAHVSLKNSSGGVRVYVTSEVPLPASLPLFAAGLSAMGFMGWRRKQKALAAPLD